MSGRWEPVIEETDREFDQASCPIRVAEDDCDSDEGRHSTISGWAWECDLQDLSTSTTCKPVVDCGGGWCLWILIRTAHIKCNATAKRRLSSLPSTEKPCSGQPVHYVKRLRIRALLADPWPRDRNTTIEKRIPSGPEQVATQDGIRCPRNRAGGPRRQQAVPSKSKSLDAATEPMSGDGSHAMQDKCRSAH